MRVFYNNDEISSHSLEYFFKYFQCANGANVTNFSNTSVRQPVWIVNWKYINGFKRDKRQRKENLLRTLIVCLTQSESKDPVHSPHQEAVYLRRCLNRRHSHYKKKCLSKLNRLQNYSLSLYKSKRLMLCQFVIILSAV